MNNRPLGWIAKGNNELEYGDVKVFDLDNPESWVLGPEWLIESVRRTERGLEGSGITLASVGVVVGVREE